MDEGATGEADLHVGVVVRQLQHTGDTNTTLHGCAHTPHHRDCTVETAHLKLHLQLPHLCPAPSPVFRLREKGYAHVNPLVRESQAFSACE
jgi:hypothetical protein